MCKKISNRLALTKRRVRQLLVDLRHKANAVFPTIWTVFVLFSWKNLQLFSNQLAFARKSHAIHFQTNSKGHVVVSALPHASCVAFVRTPQPEFHRLSDVCQRLQTTVPNFADGFFVSLFWHSGWLQKFCNHFAIS
jgi:hypothetical protein